MKDFLGYFWGLVFLGFSRGFKKLFWTELPRGRGQRLLYATDINVRV